MVWSKSLVKLTDHQIGFESKLGGKMLPVEQWMLQLVNVSHSLWQNLRPEICESDPCHWLVGSLACCFRWHGDEPGTCPLLACHPSPGFAQCVQTNLCHIAFCEDHWMAAHGWPMLRILHLPSGNLFTNCNCTCFVWVWKLVFSYLENIDWKFQRKGYEDYLDIQWKKWQECTTLAFGDVLQWMLTLFNIQCGLSPKAEVVYWIAAMKI